MDDASPRQEQGQLSEATVSGERPRYKEKPFSFNRASKK
jgi:hypothetical protein